LEFSQIEFKWVSCHRDQCFKVFLGGGTEISKKEWSWDAAPKDRTAEAKKTDESGLERGDVLPTFPKNKRADGNGER